MTVIEHEGDHECGYRDGIRRIHVALDGAGHRSGLAAAVRVERLLADHRRAVDTEVERVLKDDEAMRRAVRAHERSAVGGRTAMTRAIRAAFGGQSS